MFKNFYYATKEVLSRKKYLLVFVLVAIGFYFFNVLIQNFNNLSLMFSSLSLFFSFFFGFNETVLWYTFYSVILLSILIGLFFTFLSYQYKELGLKNNKSTGILGTFFGLFTSGCAACGVGLAAVFGGTFASFLFLLPLKGFEFSLLAIGFLVYSLNKLSKEIFNKGACEISLSNSNNLKGGNNGKKK